MTAAPQGTGLAERLFEDAAWLDRFVQKLVGEVAPEKVAALGLPVGTPDRYVSSISLNIREAADALDAKDKLIEVAVKALEPFAKAEELARQQFGDKSVTLAILLRVACYFIERPHLSRAREALAILKGSQP